MVIYRNRIAISNELFNSIFFWLDILLFGCLDNILHIYHPFVVWWQHADVVLPAIKFALQKFKQQWIGFDEHLFDILRLV